VPAQQDGFDEVFLGENCWHAIRMGGGMLSKIKYIAAYQSNPVSAITNRTWWRTSPTAEGELWLHSGYADHRAEQLARRARRKVKAPNRWKRFGVSESARRGTRTPMAVNR
jgi:hypothetical protein